MFIESERGTEKPFQVSPCEANECLSQVAFSVMQTDRTRSLGSDTLGWFDSVLELLISHLKLKTLKP